MKVVIKLVLMILMSINVFAGYYSISLKKNGISIDFSDKSMSNYLLLDDKFNPLDSSYYFYFAYPDNYLLISEGIQKQNIIQRKNITRGVNILEISINKLHLNNENLKNSKIIINFNKDIQPDNSKYNQKDFELFQHLDNIMQLNSIKNSAKAKKQIDRVQENNWYNPENNYLRFETTKDEPALVEMKKVLEIYPQWNGKPTDFLHLLNRGIEQSIYIIDNNGIIDNNDTIYFLGSRAVGDTTWFSNYTNKESFFLTYIDNVKGKRLSLMQDVSPSAKLINKILIDRHIEQDSYYATGSLFISNYFESDVNKSSHFDTRTVKGEGWFWRIISPKNYPGYGIYVQGDRFSNYQILNPLFASSEELNITAKYQTAQDSLVETLTLPQRITNHDLYFNVNGFHNINRKFSGFIIDSFDVNLKADEMFAGHNPIKFITKEVSPNTNERILIDYFRIKGNVAPVADNGTMDFKLNENEPVEIVLQNFKSNKIVIIDKLKNQIKFSNSISSQQLVRIGAGFTDTNFVTLGINDSVTNAEGKGIHFFICQAPDFNQYQYFNSLGNESKVLEALNALPDGSLIAIASSGRNDAGLLTNTLKNFGATSSLPVIDGNWVFFTVKGNSSFNLEQYNNSAIVNIFQTVNTGNGKSFNFNFKHDNPAASYFIATDIATIEKPLLKQVQKSNLRNNISKADVYFISHSDFIPAANRLKEYREKTQNLKIDVIDVQSIYNEFSYGNLSPHGIKQFLKYVYQENPENLPRYLLLFGDANWDGRNIEAKSVSKNFLPVYGNPVSDWWYGLLDGEDDFNPEMIVSRISSNTLEQANDYVDKAIDYDTTDARQWMKRFLFLTGGEDAKERNLFYNYIYSYYYDFIVPSYLCGTVDYVRKASDAPSSSSQGTEIRQKINEGNLWTIYIGHAASEIFDLDGWNAANLNNKGRYGILSTISCNTGAFAEPSLVACRNEQYILAKEKGFAAAMGSTTLGFVGPHNYIVAQMLKLLADTTVKERNLGEIFYFGKSKMAKKDIQLYTLYQYSLLGDPLIRLRVGKKTDAYLIPDEITKVIENNEIQPTEEHKSIIIKGNVYNYGYKSENAFRTVLIREYESIIDTLINNYNQLCQPENFIFDLNIYKMPGRHKITIIIDPDASLDDENINNNKYSFFIDVFKEGLTALDPQNFWNVSKTNPHFRVVNPIGSNYDYDYEFVISTDKNDDSFILRKASTNGENSDEITVRENYIDWTPVINSYPDSTIIFKAKFISKTDGRVSQWLIVPFNFEDKEIIENADFHIKSLDTSNYPVFNNLAVLNEDNEKEIEIEDFSLPFKALSIKGINNTLTYAFVNIEVGNKVFVQGFHDIGFNVVVFSSTPNGISTKYRRFDTWGRDESHPEWNWFKDSTAVDFVNFIRDSVGDDDYLFLANCKSSFRLPVYFKIFAEKPNEGSVDTLFSELRKFGSLIADTLVLDSANQGFDISFAMMGYRGAPIGTASEAINFNGDSAMISGNLIVFNNAGNFRTPVIGPAKQWKSVTINGKTGEDQSDISLIVYGLMDNAEPEIIKTVKEINYIDLSDINPDKYPRLFIEAKFKRNSNNIKDLMDKAKSYLKSMFVSFDPLPEIAVKKELTSIEPNDILRGTDVNLNMSYQNISLRTTADTLESMVNISKGGINNDYIYLNDSGIKPNTEITRNIKVNTSTLDKENPIYIDLNYNNKTNEYFAFNNKHSLLLKTKQDSIKPSVKLYIDGKEHQKGDYVRIQPEVRVELYDNSPLSITDSNSINVRINGFLHPYQRTIKSKFESINDGTNLKAVFTFTPDTLQYEDASIIIYFYDAEFNRDTVTSSARVTLLNGSVSEVGTYPNPAENELSFFLFYKAPNPGANAKITVYDMKGMEINKVSQDLTLGKNNIYFSGLDYQGNSLSSSIYFYKIEIFGEYFIEPVFGKFIILK